MPSPDLTKREPYHHGALRAALIEAAVGLAREGGPSAVVLREVARRVGVSPNAAYRHFTALPELLDVVADAALGELAQAMQDELASTAEEADPARGAVGHLLAAGRGYVHFALAEPGLFAVAFSRPESEIGVPGDKDKGELSAAGFLQRALDGLVTVGLLAPQDREAAVINAWPQCTAWRPCCSVRSARCRPRSMRRSSTRASTWSAADF